LTDLPKKNIVIIGASGFIGGSLYRNLKKNLCKDYTVRGTYHSSHTATGLVRLDITQFSELECFLSDISPDFILLAAGNKNLQQCEDDITRAYALNTQPVKSIINIVNKYQLSSRLLFFSTDYVFDGKYGNYRDTDIPNPTTNYGRTKYMAEELLLNSSINYKIIRTAAVMGRGGVFFDWILDTMIRGKQLSMYQNSHFSPTPMTFLNEVILKIIINYDQISQRILHIVGEKRMNRYQFAVLVKKFLTSEITITPENNQDTSALFQYDLSLIPSTIINAWREKDFEDYLKDEILNASNSE